MPFFEELINKIPTSIYTREPDTNLIMLFRLYCECFDEIRDVVYELGRVKDIENQNGAVLDEIGKIVKEGRRNCSDSEYRRFLSIAILRNISSGTLDTISQFVYLTTKSTEFTVRDLQKTADTRFDGKKPLDGTHLFNPGNPQPATFEVRVPGKTTDNTLDAKGFLDSSGFLDPEHGRYMYLKELIREIKSAGVDAEVLYNDE